MALEYTTFQQDQSREVVLLNDARRYSVSGQPTLVLISQEFFDMMWVTGFKVELIEISIEQNFLHVWLEGVTENGGEYVCFYLLAHYLPN